MQVSNSLSFIVLALVLFVSCNEQSPKAYQTKKVSTEFSNQQITDNSEILDINKAPSVITRSIIEDEAGNIWFATFEGIIKYDGKTFKNITSGVSSSRFFSILQDSKGNFWFGSIGAGVYHYDGENFKVYTTNDGLINNEIVCIYEDENENIWFGANGGASVFDGKSFRNYKIDQDSIVEDKTSKYLSNMERPMIEVNSIIEDKKGNYWLATRGHTFLYDGTAFKIVKHNEEPFNNVRWIIRDKKGNIWLGSNNGLWCYNGDEFKNLTTDFIGYIYEDKTGNIWTSSQASFGWTLSNERKC